MKIGNASFTNKSRLSLTQTDNIKSSFHEVPVDDDFSTESEKSNKFAPKLIASPESANSNVFVSEFQGHGAWKQQTTSS